MSVSSTQNNLSPQDGPAEHHASGPGAAAGLAIAYTRFTVQAAADPATLSRVIEYFALNNILPDTVRSRRFVNGDLVIDLRVRGLDEKRVGVITSKLQSSVLVFSVAVECHVENAAAGDRPNLRLVS